MTLDESSFTQLADAALRRCLEAIDAAGAAALDADLRDGVLTIELESGAQFIVNKHAPKREIWVSSPLSGAWHFAYDEAGGDWLDTRATDAPGRTTLYGLLARELKAAAGIAVEFA